MLNLYLLISYVSAITCTNILSMLLCLVLSYVAAAAIFINHSLYYVGLLYVLVYVGAIVVLFVYVIQLLDTVIISPEESLNSLKAKDFGVKVFNILILLTVIAIGLSNINIGNTIDYPLEYNYIQSNSDYTIFTPYLNSLQVLGQSLFSEYSFSLILSAHAIIQAVIGPIRLALNPT